MIEALIKSFTFNSRLEFNLLSDNVKNEFFEQMIFRKYKKGQPIFTEGSYPAGIFYIKKGFVKKIKILTVGKEQIIYIFSEGELMGYAALLSQETYPYSAAALTEAEVGFIPALKLSYLFKKYDDLSLMLTKNLGHEFGVLGNLIAIHALKNIRERTALALLILAVKMNFYNENKNFEILISRKELANFIGTAMESLVRQLAEFKKERIISTQGQKIFILSVEKLISATNL